MGAPNVVVLGPLVSSWLLKRTRLFVVFIALDAVTVDIIVSLERSIAERSGAINCQCQLE